jgi:hypothetical protein
MNRKSICFVFILVLFMTCACSNRIEIKGIIGAKDEEYKRLLVIPNVSKADLQNIEMDETIQIAQE